MWNNIDRKTWYVLQQLILISHSFRFILFKWDMIIPLSFGKISVTFDFIKLLQFGLFSVNSSYLHLYFNNRTQLFLINFVEIMGH